MLVRNNTGVFRVSKESVKQGAELTATQSPSKFLRSFRQLVSPDSKSHYDNNRDVVESAKHLLHKVVAIMSRSEEESSMCVAGQTTVFLSRIMDKKLTRLDSLHARAVARVVTRKKKVFECWREWLSIRSQHAVLLQALWRGAAVRSRQRTANMAMAANSTVVALSVSGVVALQSWYRSRVGRKKYAKLLLKTLPGQTICHQHLEKCYSVMLCAIQLRDLHECQRHLRHIDSLQKRLETLHTFAWGKNIVTSFGSSVTRMMPIFESMESKEGTIVDQFDDIELMFRGMMRRYEDILAESREAAGCSSLQSIEKLIKRAEIDLTNAIASRRFDVCTKINVQLERLHRARSIARDEETMNFSRGGGGSGSGGGSGGGGGGETTKHELTEVDMLRQELDETRQMITSMQLDRSHLSAAAAATKGATASRYQPPLPSLPLPPHGHHHHLSPSTLHRHDRAMDDSEEEIQSPATSIFSSVSKLVPGGASSSSSSNVFTFKMLDVRKRVRKFQSSASSIATLQAQVAKRIGIVDFTKLTLSFVDEDGDQIVVVSNEDLQDAIAQERAAGSRCLRIQYEETQRTVSIRRKRGEGGSDDGSSSDDSSSSDGSSSSDDSSSSEESTQSDGRKATDALQKLARHQKHTRSHADQSSEESSSSSSSSEEEDSEDSENSEDSEDSSCDQSIEFPNSSMSAVVPSNKCQQSMNSKRAQRVVLTSAAQSRRRTAAVSRGVKKTRLSATMQHNNNIVEARWQAATKQRRAAEENDSVDQTTLLGSVVVASALAALSVCVLLRVTK